MDLPANLDFLHRNHLLNLNEVAIVRDLSPEAQEFAEAYLIWASLKVEPVVDPPTFITAYSSRVRNIFDTVNYLDHLTERAKRRQTWTAVAKRVGGLSVDELAVVREAVGPYLSIESDQTVN